MPRRGDNIRKRSDGRWEGRYIQETAEESKAKYRSVYGKTYSEVKKKLVVATNQREAGANHTIKQTKLFKEVLDLWLEDNRIKLKESTHAKYYALIHRHIAPSLGETAVSEINTLAVNGFLYTKSRSGKLDGSGGLSPSYIRTMAFIVKSAVDFAARSGYGCVLSGEVRFPAKRKSDLEILSPGEQQTLEGQLFQDASVKCLGVLLSLYGGLRIGDVCGLMWRDIDFTNGTMHIHSTVERIANAGAENEDPRVLQYFYRRLLSRLDIPYVNYHGLRHTFATRCIESGMDIKTLSELLGHASVNITLNTYVHSSMENNRRQLENMTAICGQ